MEVSKLNEFIFFERIYSTLYPLFSLIIFKNFNSRVSPLLPSLKKINAEYSYCK